MCCLMVGFGLTGATLVSSPAFACCHDVPNWYLGMDAHQAKPGAEIGRKIAAVVIVHAPISATFMSGEELKLINWAPAYQFMTGVAYELHGASITTPIELTLGYRYLTAPSLSVDSKTAPVTTIGYDHKQ